MVWVMACSRLMAGNTIGKLPTEFLCQHLAHSRYKLATLKSCLEEALTHRQIQDMFDEIHDIASQLVLKWAKDGPQAKINVPEDFTRLTLDSIALCAMNARFDSFHKKELHPFAQAMVGFLQESGRRSQRPALLNKFLRHSQQEYDANIAFMHGVASEIAAERRKHPVEKKDLLNAMINGKDPKTGEHLSEENVINNMISFLIAGTLILPRLSVGGISYPFRARHDFWNSIFPFLLPPEESRQDAKGTTRS